MNTQMWAIVNKEMGLYVGTWILRSEAIRNHCKDLGKTWKECRRDGDRAVRVTIAWDLIQQEKV